MGHRRLVVILALPTAIALNATWAFATTSAAHVRWVETATVNPSQQANYFAASTSFGDDDVWAVGAWYRESSTPGTLTEHWNGSHWKLVPSPNVTDGYNELYGVSGASSDDVWAVGYHNIASYGSERTMAMHWNGRKWRVVDTQDLGSGASELLGVHAFAGDDAWAVGFGDDPGGFAGHAVAEHWDGTRWTLSDLGPRRAGGSILSAVGGTSGSDVWAVGTRDDRTLTEHFDGSRWRIVASPTAGQPVSGLSAVTAVAPDDVWAVGSAGSDLPGVTGAAEATLVLHWDGSSWSVVPSPNGDSPESALQDLVAFGPDDVWAAGVTYDDLLVEYRTLLEHWDGSRWRVVRTPNPDPDYNALDGLAGMDARHLWVAGAQGSQTLAMHD